MTDDIYFFVSRLRKNAVTRAIETFKLPEETTVLSDEMVVIGIPKNRAENVFRLLKVLDSKGNELHFQRKELPVKGSMFYCPSQSL
ncbi:UNVERIFIED_CONTAM: hypothetical protein BJ099_12039 [Lysinibacillus xylanilyticus]